MDSWGGGEYFSFDTLAEQRIVKDDPQLFTQKLKVPFVLDEVQNIPEIFPYLKSIVDNTLESKLKIILTGSQSFEMMKNIKESLAGRLLIKNLYPFCCQEALETNVNIAQNNFLSLLSGQVNKIEQVKLNDISIEQEILNGGYPPVWETDRNENKADWFNSYVQTYVERDVRSLINIKELSTYQKFIALAAHRCAKLINYSELGKDISVSYKTVKSYLSVLKASFLWDELPAYDKNIEKRLAKSAKGIILDSGLACYLNGITNIQGLTNSSSSYDFLFENWIISEIIKLASAFNSHIKFYHYRRSEKFEVDLIIEQAGKILPIKIKNSAKINSSWLSGIKDLISLAAGNYIGYSYVISRYDKLVELAPRIYYIPISVIAGAAN